MALIANGKIILTTEDDTPSGTGGTNNYNELFNKPQINEIELRGNKTIGINDPTCDINIPFSASGYSSSAPIYITNSNISLLFDSEYLQNNNGSLDISENLKDIISKKEDKRYYISGQTSNTTPLNILGNGSIIGNGSIFSQFNSFDDYFDFCIDNNLDSQVVIQYNLNGNDLNWMKIHYIANSSDVQCSITVQVWYQNSMTSHSFISYWGEDGPEYQLPALATDTWIYSSTQNPRNNLVEQNILVGTSSIDYRTQYNRVWLSTLNGTITGEIGTYVDLSIVGTDYYTHIEDYQLVMIGSYICYVASRSVSNLHLLIISKQQSGGSITATLPLTVTNGNLSLNYSTDFTLWQNNLALSNNITTLLNSISNKANKIDIGGGWTDLYDIDDTITADFQIIRLKLGSQRYNNNSVSISCGSTFNLSIVSPNNTILGSTDSESDSLAQFTNGSYQPSPDIPFSFSNGVAISLLTESGTTWLIITLPTHTTQYYAQTAYEGALWIYDLEAETIQDLIDVKHELQQQISNIPSIKTDMTQISWQDSIKGWATFNTIPIGSNIISITSWHDESSALDNDKAPCFCWYSGVNQNGITTSQILKARVLVGGNVDMEEQGIFFAILKYI